MKKIIKTALLTSVTLACLTTLSAKETKLLPMMSSDYCAGWGLALMGGYGKTDITGVDAATRFGIEVSLACPMVQLSAGDIRQQISVVYADEDTLTTTSIEASPFFMMDISNKAQIGFGPSLGVIFASADTSAGSKSDVVFGIGGGVNFNYDISEKIFIGADARYLWTSEANFSNNIKENLTNFRSMLKVGMHF